MLKFRASVLVTLLFMFLSSQVLAHKQVFVALKWRHQFQFAGIYAAIEKGYYEQFDLDVKLLKYDFNTSPIKEVLSGKAQFGIADSTLILRKLKGDKLVLLGVIMQNSPKVLLSLTKKQIARPSDVVGKRMRINLPYDDRTIIEMLKEYGINDREFIHQPPSFNASDINENKVDVVSTYISDLPFYFQERNIEVNMMKPADFGINFVGDMVFTSEAYFKAQPQTAMNFIKATEQGWQYALEHPDEIISLIKKKYKSKKSVAALKYEAKILKTFILSDKMPIGGIDKEKILKMVDVFKDHDRVKGGANLKGFFPEEHLPSVSRFYQYYFYISLVIFTLVLVLIIPLFKYRLKSLMDKHLQPLIETNNMMMDFFSVADKYIIVSRSNADGRLADVSSAYCELVGFHKEDMLGKEDPILFEAKPSKTNLQNIRDAVKQGQTWEGELTIYNKDNQQIYLYTFVEPLMSPEGKYKGFMSIHFNITENKVLQQMAETDSLTDLANRDKLYRDLEMECFRSNKYNFHFSIVIIDIDNFQSITDNFGQHVGDNIIKQVAALCQSHIDSHDACGRWEGKKFIIISPSTSLDEATIFAERIRQKISSLYFEEVGDVTASFGIAEYTSNESLISFMERGEKALRAAKAAGKNCIRIAEADDKASANKANPDDLDNADFSNHESI